MIVEFFNVFWIYFCKHCLFGFRLDTSRLPFSIIARFGLFYKANFWFYSDREYNPEHDCVEHVIDLIIPFICDINFIKEVG